MGVNNLLNIGSSALYANQVAMNVVGNNIANMDVVGYSRQSVRIQELTPTTGRLGQMGNGSYASEVYRNFNRFIENAYLDRLTQQSRWAEEYTVMSSVESLFNEANTDGLNSLLSNFFNNWSTLASGPASEATREALLAQAQTLAAMLKDTQTSLENVQREMDTYIRQTVTQVNNILEELQAINKQISANYIPGVNNTNTLMDERDRLVRDLAKLIDVKVVDNGGADFSVYTSSGFPLMQELSIYGLSLQNGVVEKSTSNYYGDLSFTGSDVYEYTLEFTSHNTFKVSLDGGNTWLRGENGKIIEYPVPADGETVTVKNLEISFNSLPGDRFSEGDTFYITPKTGVYWNSPTRDPINITPQVLADGTENSMRLTGGTLAGYFDIRDNKIGEYVERLNALATSLIWEVNVLHSQGSGLIDLTSLQGTYDVLRQDVALGDLYSGLAFAEKLSSGNMSFYFYDSVTGEAIVANPNDPTAIWSLDFGNGENFDPAKHSLEDVVDAINNSCVYTDPVTGATKQLLTATIENGKLCLQAADGVTFNLGTDTTGLMAALGLNTFFTGNNASNMGINPAILNNVGYINAQSVDGQNQEANEGDGYIATLIAQLATKNVNISTVWGSTSMSLIEYHASLVSLVGSDTQNAYFNYQYNTSLANDLESQGLAISGVNLDEEMTNLIRFQHSYTAAAKLITTADQMLQTILGMKQ